MALQVLQSAKVCSTMLSEALHVAQAGGVEILSVEAEPVFGEAAVLPGKLEGWLGLKRNCGSVATINVRYRFRKRFC